MVILVPVALYFYLCSSDAPRYEYDFVTTGAVSASIATSGTLKPGLMVSVGAEVSGKLLEVTVDFNDRVKLGQRLAVIDPSDVEAQIGSLEAQRERSEAERLQAEADLITAKAELLNAEQGLQRSMQLQGGGYASNQTLDEARMRKTQAEAAVLRAESSLKIAAANIRSAEASLARAKVDLKRTIIISPVDGSVINRAVEPGQTLTSGFQTPLLFEIASDAEALVLEARIDEADIGGVAADQPVSFTVDAYPDISFTGRVKMVRRSPVVNDGITTYPVIIDVSEMDDRLYPGMTAMVSITAKSRDDVLRVPNRALNFDPMPAKDEDGGKIAVRFVNPEEAERIKRSSAMRDQIRKGKGDGGNILWVQRGTSAEELTPITVKTGLRGDQFTEILDSDIRPGDRIAIGFLGQK
ncbi:RND transporter [Iodidimonas nitroreducens]|uniref:RND transporter n=1 Tax=Iodidimonas nitroreducens TaxID=1236968 RepID=A0A5A7N8T0_9PROT|nr:RND transporter [Iodidimonas nitroreducens]